jgi:hypothetical protein
MLKAHICGAVALCLLVSTAEARQCEWRGTAPTCKGTIKDCRADEDYVDLGGKVGQTDTKNTLAEFGDPCIFGGFKVLCCKKEAPPAQKLTEPNAQFCNAYAADAVARAAQGAKCGFTGPRWDPNQQFHVSWCMQQKAQQQVWSEDSARKGQLADCAKAEAQKAKATPGKGNFSKGPPEVTVDTDVDIYDKPGGEGQKLGILRKDSKVSLFERRPDQWCGVSGRAVATPTGAGFVWCGKGFELD